MTKPVRVSLSRRHMLFDGAAVGAWLGAGVAQAAAPLVVSAPVGARLFADFDPVAAMWLGYDAGHEQFTGALIEALSPYVSIKLLVRDVDAASKALALWNRFGSGSGKPPLLIDSHAPFFVRDAALFGLDQRGRKFVLDLQWTHYGWSGWCRKTFAADARRAAECARSDDTLSGGVDQRLARAMGVAAIASPLANEGGGVETNGRGLLIANEPLWRTRNPTMTKDILERHLLRLPGVRKVVWLPYGLANDPLHRGTIVGNYVGWGTGGHTDEFVRFADERTVLLAWVSDKDARAHPVTRLNHLRMQSNFEILSRSTDQVGRPLRIIKVPLPRVIGRPVRLAAWEAGDFSSQWTAQSFPESERRKEGDTVTQIATSSYLNHVVANDLVLLPSYTSYGTSEEQQEIVRRIYSLAFPGRKVSFIDAINANWVGGGPHCATLSEPHAHA